MPFYEERSFFLSLLDLFAKKDHFISKKIYFFTYFDRSAAKKNEINRRKNYLSAKKIHLSSQKYKNNAYNNGFLTEKVFF